MATDREVREAAQRRSHARPDRGGCVWVGLDLAGGPCTTVVWPMTTRSPTEAEIARGHHRNEVDAPPRWDEW